MIDGRLSGAKALDLLWQRKIEPLELADCLLEEARDSSFDGSLYDCHHRGLDSVVLQDDRAAGGGMVRMFTAWGNQHTLHRLHDDDGHFTLGAHNHKYNLALVPVFGTLTNMTFEVSESPTANKVHEYEFKSGLDDMMGVHPIAERNASPITGTRVYPGGRELMRHDDIHTVMVDEGSGCSWLVLEGPKRKDSSLIYSPRADLELSSDGLYSPMPPYFAMQLVHEAHRLIGTVK